MSPKAVTALSATRSAIGASGWLMPITVGKSFGIDASKDVSAALYLRLGGTRDFALTARPLVTVGPSRRKNSSSSAVPFGGASLGCLALAAKAIMAKDSV